MNLWVSYLPYTHQITIHAICIFFICHILRMHNPTFGLGVFFHPSSLHLPFCSLLETVALFCFIDLMITLEKRVNWFFMNFIFAVMNRPLTSQFKYDGSLNAHICKKNMGTCSCIVVYVVTLCCKSLGCRRVVYYFHFIHDLRILDCQGFIYAVNIENHFICSITYATIL